MANMIAEKTQGLAATAGKILGYLAAWALLSLALTLGSRSIRLGPGFANPLPYIAVALGLNLCGRLLRRWLGEDRRRSDSAAAPKRFAALRAGFAYFLRDSSAFNNVLLLSLAYFLGVGISALFTRLGRKKNMPASESFWTDTDLGMKEANAYSRPY
jgi:hypothetical protein